MVIFCIDYATILVITLCRRYQMRLKEYFEINGITPDMAAEALDTTVVSINRYLKGRRIPKFEMVLKIKSWTSGAVMPNDWYLPANDNEPTPPDGVA